MDTCQQDTHCTMEGNVYRSSCYLDEPKRIERERYESMIDENCEKDECFTHSFRHIWPLIFGVAFIYVSTIGVESLVKRYEIDPVYGNWTIGQCKEANIIGERCAAVDHGTSWKELKRKILPCRRGQYYDPTHNDCSSCPAEVPNNKIFAVFWETQSNCQHFVADPNSRYVTHVMWSFVEPLDDGSIPPSFQYWSQEHIKDCILQLRMRCIKNLVAIGGASCRTKFLGLKDPVNLQRFKSSAMRIVEEYGFDGIDVDDETGNMIGTNQDWLKNHGPVVVNYLQALRDGLNSLQKPDEPPYILSWDEFPSSWDPPNPANKDYPGCIIFQPNEDGWHRCYEPRISSLVDFVNVMFYNINGGDWVFEAVMKDTLPYKAAAVVPREKLVIGACSGMGCVLEQPAGQEVFNAGNGSAFYKGTMLWSATIDILYENSTCLQRMGRAGNYGVKMPFRPGVKISTANHVSCVNIRQFDWRMLYLWKSLQVHVDSFLKMPSTTTPYWRLQESPHTVDCKVDRSDWQESSLSSSYCPRSSFLDEPLRDTSEMSSDEIPTSLENFDTVEYTHTYRHAWPIVLAVLFYYGCGVYVSSLVKRNEIDPVYANWTYAQFQEENVLGPRCNGVDHPMQWSEYARKIRTCKRGQFYDPLHDDCYACPVEDITQKVFIVFWETQSDCQHLLGNPNLRYITHVVWSFLEPRDDGSIPFDFQFWDNQHIQDCILQLRTRCIKNLVGIGGASCRSKFISLKEPENLQRFIQSAMEVVLSYGFDGIDIDDETGNMIGTNQDWLKYHGPVAVNYLQSLREGLDAIQHPSEPRYILSWDEFPSAWDPPNPANKDYPGCILFQENEDGWHRCFEPRIANIVDYVNVMFYNIYGGDWVYEVVMKETLPIKAAAVVPVHKLVLGACSGMGCVLDQPHGQEIFNAGNGSAYFGGTMLWSATIDILYENSTCLRLMGRAGNYGVKLPFRAPIP